jgi:hypothetical protein
MLSLAALVLAALCLIAPLQSSAASHVHHAGLHGTRVALAAVVDQVASTLRADDSATIVAALGVLALVGVIVTAGAGRIARQATADSVRTRGPPRDAAF